MSIFSTLHDFSALTPMNHMNLTLLLSIPMTARDLGEHREAPRGIAMMCA
jgi:hypothetical protein